MSEEGEAESGDGNDYDQDGLRLVHNHEFR